MGYGSTFNLYKQHLLATQQTQMAPQPVSQPVAQIKVQPDVQPEFSTQEQASQAQALSADALNGARALGDAWTDLAGGTPPQPEPAQPERVETSLEDTVHAAQDVYTAISEPSPGNVASGTAGAIELVNQVSNLTTGQDLIDEQTGLAAAQTLESGLALNEALHGDGAGAIVAAGQSALDLYDGLDKLVGGSGIAAGSKLASFGATLDAAGTVVGDLQAGTTLGDLKAAYDAYKLFQTGSTLVNGVESTPLPAMPGLPGVTDTLQEAKNIYSAFVDPSSSNLVNGANSAIKLVNEASTLTTGQALIDPAAGLASVETLQNGLGLYNALQGEGAEAVVGAGQSALSLYDGLNKLAGGTGITAGSALANVGTALGAVGAGLGIVSALQDPGNIVNDLSAAYDVYKLYQAGSSLATALGGTATTAGAASTAGTALAATGIGAAVAVVGLAIGDLFKGHSDRIDNVPADMNTFQTPGGQAGLQSRTVGIGAGNDRRQGSGQVFLIPQADGTLPDGTPIGQGIPFWLPETADINRNIARHSWNQDNPYTADIYNKYGGESTWGMDLPTFVQTVLNIRANMSGNRW
ncbi:MAG: hypothetical protein U0931_24425 [Vulcanimicrobiota bacterium]